MFFCPIVQGGASLVDTFLLIMFYICLCGAVLSVPCSLVITFWETADLSTLIGK